MQPTIQCPKCGTVNQAHYKFCSQCAHALGGPQAVIPHPPVNPGPVPYPGPPPAGMQMVQVAQPQAPKRAIKFVLLFTIVGAIVPIVMMFALMGGGVFGDGEVEGQIESTGQPHGDYTMQPSACFSGEHESFFGVWVTPPLQEVAEGTGFKGGLKLVKGHTGAWEVFVESPIECESLNCKIRPLAADQCTVFDVQVRNTNTTVNDIRMREGHARISCAFTEGGTLRADLRFSGCT